MKAHILRLAGIALFVAAFFLPAVLPPGAAPGTGSVKGWVCATSAIMASAGILHIGAALQGAPGAISLILSGWVNPLVLLFLFFSIWPGLVRTRRVLAAAILICIVATWFFFVKAPMTPLIGHYVWVAGIFAIVAADFMRRPTSH